MPPSDPPDHTQVKGTMKIANQFRVVAPARKPSGKGSNQAPEGGEPGSIEDEGTAPMISESRKVLPQERQRATSVATLMSSGAMRDRQDGQMTSMEFEEL